MIIICDLLSRTSLFCWRNFSHEERRMGDCGALWSWSSVEQCGAVWSIESSVVDCLGNEEAVVHEQSFFCACGNSVRAAGEFYADINQDLCRSWGSSFLFVSASHSSYSFHPERGNQGRFFPVAIIWQPGWLSNQSKGPAQKGGKRIWSFVATQFSSCEVSPVALRRLRGDQRLEMFGIFQFSTLF